MSAGAIVLAAGKGTRMRSNLPKVLHRLAGKPMLVRVLDCLSASGFTSPTVVIGYGAAAIRQTAGDRCDYVDQGAYLGTGHAARVGLDALRRDISELVLMHGDEPLIPPQAVMEMRACLARTNAAVVLLTTRVDDTRGFGRVVRGADGDPAALVQEADLTLEQQAIDEVNLGAYAFDAVWLRTALPALQPHPPKGEYYLTDVVAMAHDQGRRVAVVELPGGLDVMGVNDLIQLEQASRVIYRRTNCVLMAAGITIVDSASTFVDEDACIGPDTVIRPFTVIEGQSRIGEGCEIGPQAHIVQSTIGDRCRVTASTVEHARIEDGVRVGPYAHLRPGADIGQGAEIGNYAEVKGSRVGAGTKMHHFSYLGDAEIGTNVNIGAGTVTCNYDGRRKQRTVVEDGAFIGSDTMLRAPVRVGAGAFTGAGSVVTRDVQAGTVVAGVPAREIRRNEREPGESPETTAGRKG